MTPDPASREIERWSPTKWSEIAGNSGLIRVWLDFIRNSPCNTLVTGPRRSGKTRTILHGIKSLLCKLRSDSLDPCGLCRSCQAVDAILDEHTGLFRELAGNDFGFVPVDCQNISAEQLRALRDKAGWDDERCIYYLDEIAALGANGRDKVILKPLDEWPCVWIASAVTVNRRDGRGKKHQKDGLSPDVRSRFAQKVGTTLPTPSELTKWIKDRCREEEWNIHIEQEERTIPLLIKRARYRVGFVKQPIAVAAARGRLLTLDLVRDFNFEALE
ncbi:MAG: hypothetical protein DWQ31_11730 [Planctomycetota bacterium]|nr:MAG: hypothetical protein DWQ31_11730 [Planctomycetota bacterium]